MLDLSISMNLQLSFPKPIGAKCDELSSREDPAGSRTPISHTDS